MLEAKTIIRGYFAHLDAGEPEQALDLLAANFAAHDMPSGTPPGREGVAQFVSTLQAAFSDLRFVVTDVVAEGDQVAARVRVSGRHTGEFQGITPTGKQVEYTVLELFRVEAGRLAERWGAADFQGVLTQLGAA